MDTNEETQRKLEKVLTDAFTRQTLTQWLDALINIELAAMSVRGNDGNADEATRLLNIQAGIYKLKELRTIINSY